MSICKVWNELRSIWSDSESSETLSFKGPFPSNFYKLSDGNAWERNLFPRFKLFIWEGLKSSNTRSSNVREISLSWTDLSKLNLTLLPPRSQSLQETRYENFFKLSLNLTLPNPNLHKLASTCHTGCFPNPVNWIILYQSK